MSKNVDNLKEKLDAHFKKSKNSIMEIGIRFGDEFIRNSWGNKENKKYFGLGSISKTIISTYVCEMIKKGKIDLNKTIDCYLSLNKNRNYPSILSLLTHTSGYHAFIPFNRAVWVMLTNGFNKKNIYTNVDSEWLIQSVNKKRPFRKKKYRYTDYNYALLALIIETIEGKPYKEVIVRYLQAEIGMKDTYYASTETTLNDSASWIWHDNNPFLASGGMFSTVEDMILFLDYQITHHKELQLSHAKYHKLNTNKHIFTGFSWNSFYNGQFFWHIGGQGHYRSYALFDVKKNISVIVLATVDINFQHVNRLGSSLYRNVKRNKSKLFEYLESMDDF